MLNYSKQTVLHCVTIKVRRVTIEQQEGGGVRGVGNILLG